MKILVLEGPEHEHMRGWRHFQIIVYPLRVSSGIGQNGSGEEMAKQLRGKFYPAGTWEAHPPNWQCKKCGSRWALPGSHPDCDGGAADMVQAFPAPLPEILDELVTSNQPEFVL